MVGLLVLILSGDNRLEPLPLYTMVYNIVYRGDKTMNYTNIVAVVELIALNKDCFDIYFLTKTGTLYRAEDYELVYMRDSTVKRVLGVTGKELLHHFSDDDFIFPTDEGTVYIDGDVVSDMLIECGIVG
jgi:hypothetical protein